MKTLRHHILFCLLIAGLLVSKFAVTAYAQTTSSASSSSPASTSAVPALQQRLHRIFERDQVKGVIDHLGQKKRGFIAEVQHVTQKTVTVSNAKGTQILTITPDVVVTKDNKHATIDDIAVGDWVMALGYMNKEEFLPRRLAISSQTLLPPTYDTTVGTIQAVTRTQVTLLPRHAQDPIALTIDKSTRFQDSTGKTITVSDVQVDSQYLIISFTDNNQKRATLLRSLAPIALPASPTPAPASPKKKTGGTSDTTQP